MLKTLVSGLLFTVILMIVLSSLYADRLALNPADRRVRAVHLLANMSPGQEIELQYQSHGCFHAEDRLFTFRKGPEAVEVEVGPNRERQEHDDGPRTLRLSPADILGLDEELDYHRSPMPTVCTTSDQFDVVVRELGRELRSDHFLDNSCSAPPTTRQGTTLWALTTRGRPARAAGATPPAPEPEPDLEDWPRPQYRKGGTDAFLAYAVFGNLGPLQVSRHRYRTGGLPPGVSTRSGARCNELRSGTFASVLATDEPTLVAAVMSAPGCVIVRGSVPDPQDLNYLRDTVGVLTAMWEDGAVAIFDMQSFRWFSKPKWLAQVFDPHAAVPRQHVSILWSEDRGRLWMHTRGMRKFGRPDLSVSGVPPSAREAVIELCNRFIEMMAFGAVVPEGQEIRMKTLPSGLRCHRAGSVEDPDFNNVHLEIHWPK
jgi:hypothetical protein